MKKRLIAALLTLCLVLGLTALIPTVSSVGAVYFTAVNSTLLPLTEDTMPVYSGVLLYVPFKVFSHAGVYGIPLTEDSLLRMYRGGTDARHVVFDISTGNTVGMDNHVYEDVTAKIINGTFYVPLDFICTYFGLRWDPVDCEPAPIIRIKSLPKNSILNDPTFISTYKTRMNSEYNALVNSDTAQSPDVTQQPVTPQQPTYGDVTIYLSFYGLIGGGAPAVLDALAPGYRCCFFVTETDILSDPGMIRRIAGSGNMIGIWLADGTLDEYLRVSALLFEAARLKTLLISSDNAETAVAMATDAGLVYWAVSQGYGGEEEPVDAADVVLPTVPGTRHNLLFSCTENVAEILPGVLDALRRGEYTVPPITETVRPVM